MLRFNTQKRRRTVTVLTLLFALCAAGITPATAAQTTSPPLPVITSVQLDLPSVGKITINGTGFGSGRPTVVMGGTPLAVNDGFSNTRIVANLPAPQPAAGDYLLVVTNALSNQFGELTVTIGAAGTQGPKGDKGDPGPQGPQGIQGAAGADGVSPVGMPEPPGSNCQYGGLKYIDAQGVHYVCNGAPGAAETVGVGFSGRISNLEFMEGTSFGGVTGFTSSSIQEGAVTVLSPNRNCTAENLVVKLVDSSGQLTGPGVGNLRAFQIRAEGVDTGVGCTLIDDSHSCTSAGFLPYLIVAGSRLSISVISIGPFPRGNAAIFGWECR